jgi:hypothetical protein
MNRFLCTRHKLSFWPFLRSASRFRRDRYEDLSPIELEKWIADDVNFEQAH